MNFHHLMEELEITARRQHLDFIGIADHLHRCRFESMALEKDAGLQRMESERSKVQIMTMHVSKGLEFPVVFIAGGMRADPKESEYTYHEDGAVVHDIQKTDTRGKNSFAKGKRRRNAPAVLRGANSRAGEIVRAVPARRRYEKEVAMWRRCACLDRAWTRCPDAARAGSCDRSRGKALNRHAPIAEKSAPP